MIIVDGLEGNPMTYESGKGLKFVSRTLNAGDKFMIGDPYFGIDYNSTAYLFVIAT